LGMWCCVAGCIVTNLSKDHNAFRTSGATRPVTLSYIPTGLLKIWCDVVVCVWRIVLLVLDVYVCKGAQCCEILCCFCIIERGFMLRIQLF
jgi:hypothetical protein